MKPGGWPVLRPGDWVHFDGAEYQVIALAGMSVRLRPDAGPEQVVLASYLMAAPGFAVIGGEPLPEMVPFGLLDGLPIEVLDAAREWERPGPEAGRERLPGRPGPGAAFSRSASCMRSASSPTRSSLRRRRRSS